MADLVTILDLLNGRSYLGKVFTLPSRPPVLGTQIFYIPATRSKLYWSPSLISQALPVSWIVKTLDVSKFVMLRQLSVPPHTKDLGHTPPPPHPPNTCCSTKPGIFLGGSFSLQYSCRASLPYETLDPDQHLEHLVPSMDLSRTPGPLFNYSHSLLNTVPSCSLGYLKCCVRLICYLPFFRALRFFDLLLTQSLAHLRANAAFLLMRLVFC